MAWRRVVRLAVGEVLKFESRAYPKPLGHAVNTAGPYSNPEFRCETADASVKIFEEFPAPTSPMKVSTVLAEIDCPWMISPMALESVCLAKNVCFRFQSPGTHRIIETRFSEETGQAVEEICHRVVVEGE